jgi:hypothetical protein
VANVPTVVAKAPKAEERAEERAAVNAAKVAVNVVNAVHLTPNAQKAKTCKPKKVLHKKRPAKTAPLPRTKAKTLSAVSAVRATVTAVIAANVSPSNAATQQAKRLLSLTTQPNRQCMTAAQAPKHPPVRTLSVRQRQRRQLRRQSPWHRSPACGRRNPRPLQPLRHRLLQPLKQWPRPMLKPMWLHLHRQGHLHQRLRQQWLLRLHP